MTVGSKDSFTDGSGGTVFFMEIDTVWGNQTTVNKYTGEIVSLAGYNRSFDNYDAGGAFDSLAGTIGNDALIFDTSGDTENEDRDPSHYAGIDQFAMQGGNDIINLTSGVGGATSYTESCLIFGGNGAGADILWAGSGDDTLIGENNLISSGTAGNDSLHGGAGSDTLYGDARIAYNAPTLGNDTVNGGTGNDTLYGDAQTFQSSAGATFTGVRGADTFVFDGPGSGVDTIGDFEAGRDRIALAASYGFTSTQALARTADNGSGNAVIDLGNGDTITLFGVSKASLTVADFTILANVVTGTDGNDDLASTAGPDDFRGQQGNDTVNYDNAAGPVTASLQTGSGTAGQAEGDTYTSIENLRGGAQADSLTGDGQDNILDGGAGADTLTGLTGNDTYFVDNEDDVVVEADGEGNDIIQSSISYTLTDTQFIETLRLINATGNADLDLTGNSFANRLIGDGGDNVLDGGGGADRLEGGRGDDTYYVDDARDVVYEFAGGGFDTVLVDTGLLSYALQQTREVETLRAEDLTATTALKLYGNSYANHLIGNAGNNTLNGRDGGDVLEGGAGNDTYFVRSGDEVIEASGQASGNDTVIALGSYSLTPGAAVETLRLVSKSDDINALLIGNEFDQRLIGNADDNTLDGEFGNDVLQGGGGIDTFRFSTDLKSTNVDHIRDFTVGEDRIQLLFDGSRELKDQPGGLRDDVFADITNGTDGVTESTRLLYSAKTGVLSYDADGSGEGAAITFAILDNRAQITASDFYFV